MGTWSWNWVLRYVEVHDEERIRRWMVSIDEELKWTPSLLVLSLMSR